jgi:hypothetical protein
LEISSFPAKPALIQPHGQSWQVSCSHRTDQHLSADVDARDVPHYPLISRQPLHPFRSLLGEGSQNLNGTPSNTHQLQFFRQSNNVQTATD